MAGERVVAAQEAPPHAAVDAMEDRQLGRVEQVRTRHTSHANTSRRPVSGADESECTDEYISVKGRQKYFFATANQGRHGLHRWLSPTAVARWKQNFGTTAGAGSIEPVPVPEPQASILLAIGSLIAMLFLLR
jgi:hypothetical protein